MGSARPSPDRPYRTSIDIAAPPPEVFPFFTDAERMVQWMGEFAVLDPTPGGEFTLDIQGVPVRGRYVEIDSPRRIVVTWGHAGSDLLPPGASTLEVRFADIPGGTRVTVEHRGLPPEEADKHASGWPVFLAQLAAAAGSRR
jgi:uncharacterized protein YndB with AHSA1/START domain